MSASLERAYQLAKLSHGKGECEELLKEAKRDGSVSYYLMGLCLMEPTEDSWEAIRYYLEAYQDHECMKVDEDKIWGCLDHWKTHSFIKLELKRGTDRLSPFQKRILKISSTFVFDSFNDSYQRILRSHEDSIRSLNITNVDPSDLHSLSIYVKKLKNLEYLKIVLTEKWKNTIFDLPSSVDDPTDYEFEIPDTLSQLSIKVLGNRIRLITNRPSLTYLEILSVREEKMELPNLTATLECFSINDFVVTPSNFASINSPRLNCLSLLSKLPVEFDYSQLESFIYNKASESILHSAPRKEEDKIFQQMTKLKTLIAPRYSFMDGDLRSILNKNRQTLESLFIRCDLGNLVGWSCDTLIDLYMVLGNTTTSNFSINVPNLKNLHIVSRNYVNVLNFLENLEAPLTSFTLSCPSFSTTLIRVIRDKFSSTLQVLTLEITEEIDLIELLLEADISTVLKISVSTDLPVYMHRDKIQELLQKCTRTIMLTVEGATYIRKI